MFVPFQELVDKVVKFQHEAQEALEEATPNTVHLESLMETAVTLDIDLPEIPRLKQVQLPVLDNNTKYVIPVGKM